MIPRLRAPLAIYALATIPYWLSMMDMTILNVAYDQISASLGSTLDEVSWASTAYILAGITMLPLTGWFVARFGRKTVFITILALFGAGSLLCGFATSAAQLGAFRVLQGIGGGLLGSIAQSVLLDAYPDENRAEAINLLSALTMIAPIGGTLLAGAMLERFSWPLLFFINVPLTIATIWLCAITDVDQKVKSAPGRFSYTTIALLFGTLFAFQYVVQSGERLAWFDAPSIRWATLAAIVLGGVLVFQQLRTRAPMIALRLFRNREFLVGNILSVVAGGSNYAIGFIGPLLLQQVLGYTPLQTGLLMIPSTFGMFAGLKIQEYLSKRISLFIIVPLGMVLASVSFWYTGLFRDMADFGTLGWLRAIMGVAFGVFVVPIGVFAFNNIQKRDVDSASGLFALLRQAGGMIGIALIGTLLERSQNAYVRTLLLDVPRWPVLLGHRAPSRAAIVGSVLQHAQVLAYQHVYAVTAVLMIVTAIVIAAYGALSELGRVQPRVSPAFGEQRLV